MTTQAKPRDYALFEAELTGAALNISLLRRLMHWIMPYWKTFIASIVLVLLASALAVWLPVIISIGVIDHIIRGEVDQIAPDFFAIDGIYLVHEVSGYGLLLSACILYSVTQVVWAMTSHWHRMTLISAVINGLRDLRRDLFYHLETRPSSFYDNVAVGRVMTRVTNDIEALYELLRGLGTLIGELVPFFVAIFVMLAVDFEMTGILLLYVPVMVVATVIFRRFTQRLFRLVRQSVSQMNQNLQENLSGLQVVQISNREDYNYHRYRRLNSGNLLFESRSMRLETLYTAFNDSMASIAIGVILWYAGGQVIQDQLSLGGMILFTRFIDMLFHPIVVFGEQINILFRAMASGERIFQALDWDEATHEPEKPFKLPERLTGEIEFRNVNFSYDAVPVLLDVNFKINAGEKLAVVGATGSGKSTLIRLLGRFYDIEDETIFLDGVDINTIHTRDLRKRIGVVLQDFHIFSGTVLENIQRGNPKISIERAIIAARGVNAHSFIERLAHQYDTRLSERGQNLSQGQRQLLAFARVLASDPEIFVLDEATANIDTNTELLIQDAFRKITENRTSIIIAHRLQTIQDCDRVLVMDHGQVAEIGTHDELLEAGGIYATLHSLQFQATESLD